jgi:hypothetical protein
MRKSGMSRREFLETGRETVAGGVAVSLAAALPNATWAAALSAVDQPTADVLLRMCRVLYPHDDLSDDYYAACVEALDQKGAKDPALAQLLSEGVSNLNALNGGSFLDLSEAQQVAALTSIESSSFFQSVRGHMVVALYNDRKVWSHFGYEGPSFPFGGYLERGFDDIDWLPQG